MLLRNTVGKRWWRRLPHLAHFSMTFLLTLFVWAVLMVLCWPLALVLLVAWPILWVLSLPFRALAIVVDAVFALLKAVLFLPSRLLGQH